MMAMSSNIPTAETKQSLIDSSAAGVGVPRADGICREINGELTTMVSRGRAILGIRKRE